MSASFLHWQIAKSKVPPFFKLTLYTLALHARAEKSYANIFFSKEEIGRLSSRGERAAREDMSDLASYCLITTGRPLLVIIDAGGGRRRSTTYQLLPDDLKEWSAADTKALALLRRTRRGYEPKAVYKPGTVRPTFKVRKTQPKQGSVLPSERGSVLPDKIGSVLPESTALDLKESEVRSADADQPVENAGATKAASAAHSPTDERLADDLLAMESPSKRRHNDALGMSRSTAQLAGVIGNTCYVNQDPEDESPSYWLFHAAGLKKLKEMADEGLCATWAELRDGLKSRLHVIAVQRGIDARSTDLIDRVLRSLEVQHAHFVTASRVPPVTDDDRRSAAR